MEDKWFTKEEYKEYKDRTVSEFVRASHQNARTAGVEAKLDDTVLKFIAYFCVGGKIEGDVENRYETLRSQFRAGYCWHFAHMLKTTFGRGEVCWAAPFGHFVWMDNEEIPYDVEGFYDGEADEFIPEEFLGDALKDFKHVPGEVVVVTKEQMQEIKDRYHATRGLQKIRF